VDAADVVDVVSALEGAGVEVWVEGGWGVDALLCYQRRPHKDLDLVVRTADAARTQSLLKSRGLLPVSGTPPTGYLTRDASGRAVDVRAVTFEPDGSAVYRAAEHDEWIYPPGAFEGRGSIAETDVRCLTADAQMLAHTGYAYIDKDVAEVWALHDAFETAIPSAYTATTRPNP
jgi:lincosamide nucleotidyltransferase A/C/D/E